MSRKRLIVYSAVALIVVLSLVEKATNSVELVPANVVSVSSTPANKGPDLWQVTFELSSRDSFQTDPVTIEPQLAPGDPVCVRMHACGCMPAAGPRRNTHSPRRHPAGTAL